MGVISDREQVSTADTLTITERPHDVHRLVTGAAVSGRGRYIRTGSVPVLASIHR